MGDMLGLSLLEIARAGLWVFMEFSRRAGMTQAQREAYYKKVDDEYEKRPIEDLTPPPQ